jgi:hypothetical protein
MKCRGKPQSCGRYTFPSISYTRGSNFLSQLAEFLAACRNARPVLIDDLSRQPHYDGLDKYSDDDDGAALVAAPPVPSL